MKNRAQLIFSSFSHQWLVVSPSRKKTMVYPTILRSAPAWKQSNTNCRCSERTKMASLPLLEGLCWYDSMPVCSACGCFRVWKGTKLITPLLISLKTATPENVLFYSQTSSHCVWCRHHDNCIKFKLHMLITLMPDSYINPTPEVMCHSSVNTCVITSHSLQCADILNGVFCSALWQVGGNTIK